MNSAYPPAQRRRCAPRSPAPAVSDDTLGRIDRFVAEQVRLPGWPGASLAVLSGGQTVQARGYGVTDRERKAPVTPDTEYGTNLVWHAGETEGASSAAVLMPERQLGVVILAGARSTLPEAIARQVARMLIGLEPGSPASGMDTYTLIGRVLMWAVVLSAMLLLGLLLTLRRGRPVKAPRSGRKAMTVAATLALAAALVASLPFWASPLLPGPFGIHGYPPDLLVGAGSLALSLGLWAVYWLRDQGHQGHEAPPSLLPKPAEPAAPAPATPDAAN